MFKTSNYTLQNLKDAAEEKVKEEDNVTDSSVARAANEALKTYFKFERRLMPYRHIQTEVLSIPSSGLDLYSIGISYLPAWLTLTLYSVGDLVQEGGVGYVCVQTHTSGTFLTDLNANKVWEVYYPLYSETEGFCLYEGSKKNINNMVPFVFQGADDSGYYIKGGRVFINPEITTSKQVVVEYIESPVLNSVNSISMDYKLPIVSDADGMFEEYVLTRFFRREGEPDRSQEAEARFGERLSELFRNTTMKAYLL